MNEILIIGYGNPLRGDDGVGWHVIRELQKMSSDGNIQFLTYHQLTPELAESLSTPKCVIFIDSAIGDTPGEIRRMNLHLVSSTKPFNHHLTPETLLSMTRSIYGRAAEGILFTVTGESFKFSETLSPAIQQKIPVLVNQIYSYMHNMELIAC